MHCRARAAVAKRDQHRAGRAATPPPTHRQLPAAGLTQSNQPTTDSPAALWRADMQYKLAYSSNFNALEAQSRSARQATAGARAPPPPRCPRGCTAQDPGCSKRSNCNTSSRCWKQRATAKNHATRRQAAGRQLCRASARPSSAPGSGPRRPRHGACDCMMHDMAALHTTGSTPHNNLYPVCSQPVWFKPLIEVSPHPHPFPWPSRADRAQWAAPGAAAAGWLRHLLTCAPLHPVARQPPAAQAVCVCRPHPPLAGRARRCG